MRDLEEEALIEIEFKPVGLGDHVLRSSTTVEIKWIVLSFRLKDQAERI